MISFLKEFAQKHLLVIILCIITGLVWPKLRTNFTNNQNVNDNSPIKLFTRTELAKFNGEQDTKLYLAILGSVYDVTKGAKHYGAGGTYHYFTGKDASVAFVTGEFEDTAQSADDDVLGRLSAQEIYGLHQWKQFYDKEYKFLGYLVGRYYNNDGSESEYMNGVKRKIEYAIEENKRQDELRQKYPQCNIEWKQETGTRVWCTEQSGGFDREWVGVPRKYFEVGRTEFRCACVPENRLNDVNLKEYDDCEPNATTCYYKV